MYTVETNKFNSGYYLLTEDLSENRDGRHINIRKGSIVYISEELTFQSDGLVKIRPRNASYWDYITMKPAEVKKICIKTPVLIQLERRLKELNDITLNASFFKRRKPAYKEAIKEIEQVKDRIFSLEDEDQTICDNEAVFNDSQSICINRQNPYSITVTPPGVMLNLDSIKGFTMGDTFALFGQKWTVMSENQAFASLPEDYDCLKSLTSLSIESNKQLYCQAELV